MVRQGLRVKDLADMVGLSPSYLSLILNGERANLSDYHKDAIALALGTTVADLYAPGIRDVTALVRPSQPPAQILLAEPQALLRRTRDVTPFEDLMRAFNLSDPLLLASFYRELNSLSDEDVRKLGGMIRNVLVRWQAAARSQGAAAQTGEAAATAAAFTVEPDHRALLWLVTYLSSVLGDVPLPLVATATSWPQERVHRNLEALLLAGVVAVVSSGEAPATAVLVRPTGQVDLATSSQWISAERKREFLLALARGIDPSSVRPEHLAQMYLEGGDLRASRECYERSAVDAVSAGMWRAAKTYLLVISSLDTILGTPGEERVSVAQMLVATCQNLGETEEALAYQQRNLAFWEKAGARSDLCRGLLTAGSILARRREWSTAEAYLNKALGLSTGDFTEQARVRIALGAVLSERGLFQRCRDEYERALELAGKAQEQSLMAQALLGLGRVSLWRSEYQKCAQYLNRVLSLSEKRDPAIEVLARTEMGKLRFFEGSFALAKDHLDKAIQGAAAVRSPESEHAAKAWLSRCMGKGKEPADSQAKSDLAYAACAFFRVLDERHGLISSILACAEAEAGLGRRAEAEALFQEAVAESRNSENPVLEGMACEAYGNYLRDQDEDLAQVMLERSRWVKSKIR